jgi:hypothetical protein
MALLELVEQQADGDLVREMLAFAADRIMEAEVEVRTGAAKGARSPLREVQRNGYRDRDWDTRAGRCQRRSKIRPLGGAKPGHFGFGRNARHVAAASQPRLPNSWRLTGRLGPSGPSQRG